MPAPSLQRPPAANITVKHVTAGQAFQVYPPEAAFHTTQVPGYSGSTPLPPSANAWVPSMTLHSPQVALEKTTADAPLELSSQQTPILPSHLNVHVDAFSQAAPPPTAASRSVHPQVTQFRPPARAVATLPTSAFPRQPMAVSCKLIR